MEAGQSVKTVTETCKVDRRTVQRLRKRWNEQSEEEKEQLKVPK